MIAASLVSALALLSCARASGPAWEFGLDPGLIVPVSQKQFGHSVPNAAVYNILVAESVGDEVAEGFVPPPPNDFSTVQGSYRSTADLGMHLYRALGPSLSVGLEGGYGVKQKAYARSRGIYVEGAKFLDLGYDTSFWRVATLARLGRWHGPWRAAVSAGPELTMIGERVEVRFTDPDDPQVRPEVVVDRHTLYAGAAAGVSFDWRLDHGMVGVSVQYHKVVAGGATLDYILPSLRFSTAFGGE